jgi:hypothetical protein
LWLLILNFELRYIRYWIKALLMELIVMSKRYLQNRKAFSLALIVLCLARILLWSRVLSRKSAGFTKNCNCYILYQRWPSHQRQFGECNKLQQLSGPDFRKEEVTTHLNNCPLCNWKSASYRNPGPFNLREYHIRSNGISSFLNNVHHISSRIILR